MGASRAQRAMNTADRALLFWTNERADTLFVRE